MGAASTLLWADTPGCSWKANISIFCEDFYHETDCLRNFGCAITRMSSQIQKATSRCQNVVAGESQLDFPGVSDRTALGLVPFVLSKMKKCKNFWKCRDTWRWWKEERGPKQLFFACCWNLMLPSLVLAMFGWKVDVFGCILSLPWTFVTLLTFFYPIFSIALFFCALLCFGEEFELLWPANPPSNFSSSIFLGWFSLPCVLTIPFLTLSLHVMNIFLFFQTGTGEGRCLLHGEQGKSNLTQQFSFPSTSKLSSLLSSWLRFQEKTHHKADRLVDPGLLGTLKLD